MTEVRDEKKEQNQERRFVVIGSASLFTKYKLKDKSITVHLENQKSFTGKIRWYDDYAIKLILPDGSGSITIPVHNISYYESEHFLIENESAAKISKRVFRGVPKSTGKERQQLAKYKYKNNLLNFHLINGKEITGKLSWYMDHVYSIKTGEGDRDYQITKRHILYYSKLEAPKPKRTDKGSIKMVNTEKGFGFIIYDKGDLFFHRSEVAERWEKLEPGQEVAFGIADGKKGKVAVNVKILK